MNISSTLKPTSSKGRHIFKMKPLFLNVALVVLTFCSSTGAAPMVDDNNDRRDVIKSLQVIYVIVIQGRLLSRSHWLRSRSTSADVP